MAFDVLCVPGYISIFLTWIVLPTELDSQFMWIVVFEDLEEFYSLIRHIVRNLQKQGLALSVLLLRLLVLQHVDLGGHV